MIEPTFFGRCRQCNRRPIGGLDGLIGGTCPRCWNEASTRIRARFASDTNGDLRYSLHGRAKTLHPKKSSSRAETSPGYAVGGRENGQLAGEPPVAPPVPHEAVSGAGSSAAPA